MSEPEVEPKPVSVVGLIEAYEAKGWRPETQQALYQWLIQHDQHDCISYRGKIYWADTEYREVFMLESVREASEIDAESGVSAPQTQPLTNNTT